MQPRLFLVSLFLLLLAPVQAAAQLLGDLPPLKDPTVLAFDDSSSPSAHLLVAMEGWNLSGWWMEGAEIVGEVDVKLPPREWGWVRWGPALLRHEGKVYLYYGYGRAHEWPTFRLAVAVADEAEDLEWEGDRLAAIRFPEEHSLDLHRNGEFRGTDIFGLIDPEVVLIDGRLHLYYTGVIHGIVGTRWHESFIHSQLLADPLTPADPADDHLVYAGLSDATDGSPENDDAGIAEAPTLFPEGEGYAMIFSSHPSDDGQFIAVVRSSAPHGEPWQDRQIIYARPPSPKAWKLATAPFESLGVGGQTVIWIGGEAHLLYQGLGVLDPENPDESPRFRLELLPLGEKLHPQK